MMDSVYVQSLLSPHLYLTVHTLHFYLDSVTLKPHLILAVHTLHFYLDLVTLNPHLILTVHTLHFCSDLVTLKPAFDSYITYPPFLFRFTN